MRIVAISVLLLSIVLVSCKQNMSKKIIGTWHGIKLESPDMDAYFANNKNYIDTLGANGDSATNVSIYGSNNIDSLRQILRTQFDSAKNMEYGMVLTSKFKFKPNNEIVMAFGENADSSKYRIVGDTELVLTQIKKQDPSAPDSVTIHILSLSDSILKLQFHEETSVSTVTFRREGK